MFKRFVFYIEQNVDEGLKGKQFLASSNVRALVKVAIHNAFARVMNEELLKSQPLPEEAKPESAGPK